MATSFSAAALGAEGLAADVTMLVGNGYVPGHAAYALELLRADAGVRGLFERRLWHASRTRPSTSTPPTSRRPARWPDRSAGRSSDLAQQHTTVVRRARHAAARRARRRRPRRHPVGQPARRRRPRRRRARARRRAAGLGRAAPRRGRRPADPGPEGGRRLGDVPAARGRGRRRGPAAPPARPVGAGITQIDRAARRARADDRRGRRRAPQAVDLPHRRHRRHLRGHPAGAGRPPARAPTSSP